jgi:ABC-2 type transport system permease protein
MHARLRLTEVGAGLRARVDGWRSRAATSWATRVAAPPRARPSPGWRIVAAKELADNLHSVRFTILLVLIGLAGVAAVLSASGGIREAAGEATRAPSPFLLLYTIAPDQLPPFVALIGFLGPLLGIAFGFDAVNNERAQGTLPRLVAQPIHRDDVINGKFAAGLATIVLTLTALVALVAGLGIIRLGVVPGPEELARLLAYLVVTTAYIGLWLGVALLCSVALARAATSALVAIATWIVLTIFGTLIIGLLADLFTGGASTPQEAIAEFRLTRALSWLSPQTLYDQATTVLLDPEVRTVGLVLPEQADRAVPGALPLGQSLLVVWPQITALLAGCVVVFALAYVLFLRQEVRA